jgi:S-adenosylmethionine/arginine decarboxylase-like enzyme
MLISWGKHLIIDANQCLGSITSIDNINGFITDLCRVGGMTKKGKMIVETFPDNQYNRERDLVGYSVVQIISLSNITLHINFISKTIYMDWFTCGKLEEDKVINLFRYYFRPETIKTILLNREAIDANVPFVT